MRDPSRKSRRPVLSSKVVLLLPRSGPSATFGLNPGANKVINEVTNSSEPKCFQTWVDITQVDSPSSMIHQCMIRFLIVMKIWKETNKGSQSFPVLRSNLMRHES